MHFIRTAYMRRRKPTQAEIDRARVNSPKSTINPAVGSRPLTARGIIKFRRNYTDDSSEYECVMRKPKHYKLRSRSFKLNQ